MDAKKAERQERETGTLHVAKQGPGIQTQEAITLWEPRRTEPKPCKTERASQQQLARLQANANEARERVAKKNQDLSCDGKNARQAQIQPEGQRKAERVKTPKDKNKGRPRGKTKVVKRTEKG